MYSLPSLNTNICDQAVKTVKLSVRNLSLNASTALNSTSTYTKIYDQSLKSYLSFFPLTSRKNMHCIACMESSLDIIYHIFWHFHCSVLLSQCDVKLSVALHTRNHPCYKYLSYLFTSPLCSPGNWEQDKKLRPSMQPTNRQTHNPESLELYIFQ